MGVRSGWGVLAAFLGAACASNAPVPLGVPGGAFHHPTVTPSLSLPDPGFHPYGTAGFSLDSLAVSSPSATEARAQSWGASGGILVQNLSLRDEVAWGTFGSLEGGVSASLVDVTHAIDGTLTPAQAALFPGHLSAQDWGARTRVGLVGKAYFGTLALYGLGGLAYETGDYRAFRQRADGVGRFYNLSDDPLVASWGWGLDMAVGYRGIWALGLDTEAEASWIQTQSLNWASVNPNTGSYGAWEVGTSPGGRRTWSQAVKFESYLDIGPARASVSLSTLTWNLSSSSDYLGTTGTAFHLIYRW